MITLFNNARSVHKIKRASAIQAIPMYGPNSSFTSTLKDGACLTKGAYVILKPDLVRYRKGEYVPTLYIAAAATAPPITAKPRKPPRIRSLAAPPE
jgi:hypothetical protein